MKVGFLMGTEVGLATWILTISRDLNEENLKCSLAEIGCLNRLLKDVACMQI